MIRCKIDVLKIDKAYLFKGAKGTYCDITLINLHGDKYGNDFMVVQDLGKDARLAGTKGPILGNGKIFGDRGSQQQESAPRNNPPPRGNPKPAESIDEDVPF